MTDAEKYWFDQGIKVGKKATSHPEQLIQEEWDKDMQEWAGNTSHFNNFFVDFLAFAEGIKKGSTYYKNH